MIRCHCLSVRPVAALGLLVLLGLGSCEAPHGGRMPLAPAPEVSAIRAEPRVRVRIARSVDQVTIDAATSADALVIGPAAGQERLTRPRRFAAPVTVRYKYSHPGSGGGGFLITDGRGATVRWGLSALRVEAVTPGRPVRIGKKTYPGRLVLHPTDSGLDVVNHVPIEQYLPGVLEHELYDSWPLQAYVAQAIAARSYAIAQQARHPGRTYDLESTTASQVYGGKASNPKAVEAVRRTRGQVLVYDGRVVPAYYSSCAGGVGQSAAIAFPDDMPGIDIPPLRGRRHGWGSGSSYYRWGPITRDRATLARRIAAWGKAQEHPIANLRGISRIDVVRRSRTGRAAVFRVTDRRGRRFDLPCESFRFACNYGGAGLPKVEADQRLRSSNVQVRVQPGRVVFFNGKGFGHGVGMCQWSANQMAAAGYNGHAIVAFFYPGARVVTLY